MTSGDLTVRKLSGQMILSRDQGIDWGIVEPTPAEQKRRDDASAEYQAQRQAATEAWPVFVAALAEVTDPVARLILDLHGSRDGYCRGCEVYGYDAESPPWPCVTTTAVALAVGVPVPQDLWMAEQAKQ